MRARLLLMVLLLTLAPTVHADDDDAPAGNTFVPFPFYFYSPETKSGGGASLTYVTRREGATREDRPSSYNLMLVFTQRKQYSISFSMDRYSRDERWHLIAGASLSEFPTTYFGIGNETDRDVSEDYTPQTVGGMVQVERQVRTRWRTGPSVQFLHEEIVERPAGATMVVPSLVGGDGGNVSILAWSLTWDDRDHLFYPRAGRLVTLSTGISSATLGSDFDFSVHTLDARAYRSLGDGWGRPVLAARFWVSHNEGTPPFQQLPGLGGADLLRGHYGGRFRDRNAWAAQVELRLGHWRRTGLVVFGGVGGVAHRPGEFRLDQVRSVYGLGLRWQLSRAENLHVRADLGRNEEGGSGFYLDFMEAF